MRKLYFILLFIFTISNISAQFTIIEDPRFEQALIDLGIDSDQSVNGQILTGDALLVTHLNLSPSSLTNYPYPADDIYEGMIHNLSGIEAFTNVEHLVINTTMIDYLNINDLIHLKYLDCVDNMLTSINVASNPLLEYINISSEGDVIPINNISEIDLSNNPNIQTVIAHGVYKINLNNNHNDMQNMLINVSCSYCFDFPEDLIVGNVCIEVDNVELAQNNQAPYDGWTVYHSNININYTDNLEQCSLNTSNFYRNTVSVYPNPVNTGIVSVISSESDIYKILIFDSLGRKILEKGLINDTVDISMLQTGHYVMKIMFINGGSQPGKLIVK